MDSFYDQPRIAPSPVTPDQFFVSPVVPDISLICAGNSNQRNKNTSNQNYMPYNVWKYNNCSSNKENIPEELQNYNQLSYDNAKNVSQIRKQVRFESPVVHQTVPTSCENFVTKPIHLKDKNMTPSMGNTFEQIYMANVPTRQLDLSLIDVNSSNINQKQSEMVLKPDMENKNLESEINCNQQFEYEQIDNCNIPKTYREYCRRNENVKKTNFNTQMIRNDEPVIDIFNYKSGTQQNRNFNYPCIPNYANTNIYNDRQTNEHDFIETNRLQLPKKVSNVTQTSVFHQNDKNSSNENQIVKQQTSDEPTVKDLLKIIQQQNEQLLTLQKQVSLLLEQKEKPKCIEAASSSKEIENHEQHERVNTAPRKGPLPKFAIDVMTSLEVSIRRPQQNNHRYKEFFNQEPKIQEITENSSEGFFQTLSIEEDRTNNFCSDKNENRKSVDVSLTLNEPLPVREDCPSPEHSVHVDMQDYSSESENDNEDSSSDLSWTFYNNVMGQVNNILKKSKVVGENAGKSVDNECKSKTSRKVRDATMKHLKQLSINLPSINDSTETIRTSGTNDYTPTEVSFAVKQLLMKYLPDEHLAKITYKNAQNIPVNTGEEKVNLLNKRPEFSFATVQYMKKYNLITSNGNLKDQEPTAQAFAKPPLHNNDPHKILDITALKQQPKLL